MRLSDDVGCLVLRLGKNLGALLLGLLLGLGDDLLSLAVGLDELVLVALRLGRGLRLGLLGRVEIVLDLLLTLLHRPENRRPGKLGHDEPDDEECDERGDELRGLWQKEVGAAGAVGEGDGGQREDRAQHETANGRDARAPLHVPVHTSLQLSLYVVSSHETRRRSA